MILIFTIDRNKPITIDLIVLFIRRHRKIHFRFDLLDRYYRGDHNIMHRQKERSNLANNRIVCNHAKHITDTAAGYLTGNPIGYNSKQKQDISGLIDWLATANSSIQDMDLAKDASIFGRAFELVYLSNDDSPTPRLVCFDPRQAFVVYDNTVEHNPVFGVYYYQLFNEDGTKSGFSCWYATESRLYTCRLSEALTLVGEIEEEENIIGEVPLIEYANNEEHQGDFEQVVSLIDAYNILQSDRVNDKQQFVEALLLIKGATMGDDADEASETYSRLKAFGVLELDKDAEATWLTRTMDESSVEILRRSIEQDIHKFSGVPCLSDENFAGNSSGVAMKYKLLGLEQVTKIKERYFRDGIKKRISLFCRIMAIKGMPLINPNDIEIVFSRNLPANEVELAQVVNTLNGMVTDKTLLGLLPFVQDVEAEVEELKQQKKQALKTQKQAFDVSANTPLEGEAKDEE